MGTIELRRPRVRNLDERFESQLLPLFKRQTRQVRDLIPELYLHGLASGDFELALRGLLVKGRRYRHRRYSGSRRSGRVNTSNGRACRSSRRSGPIFGLMEFMSKLGLAKRRRRCWWSLEFRRMAASGFWPGARLSREQGIVGFGVAAIEIARGEKRQAFCWRRQPGIMGWRGRFILTPKSSFAGTIRYSMSWMR